MVGELLGQLGPQVVRFNGASTTWSRMVDMDGTGPSTRPCFNGASTTWSRMGAGSSARSSMSCVLQRGLDHVVEDGKRSLLAVLCLTRLQRGLDHVVEDGPTCWWTRPPRVRLQRGLDHVVEDGFRGRCRTVRARRASTGPRPRGRGWECRA